MQHESTCIYVRGGGIIAEELLSTFYASQYVCFFRSQQYEFVRAKIPDTSEQKVEFSKKLRKYNISLFQYAAVLQQKEIKP